MVTTALINDIAYTQLSMKTKKVILGQCLFLTFAVMMSFTGCAGRIGTQTIPETM